MLSYQRITMFIFVSLLFNGTAAWAETRYISDQLVVSLREQPQDGSETIVYLKTDTPVEVLEVGEQYIQVKTKNGEVGYIQKSYLTEKIPKATVISRLTRENQGLKERIQELEKQYREAFSEGDEAQKKILSELEDARLQIAKLDKALLKSETELAERTQAYEALKRLYATGQQATPKQQGPHITTDQSHQEGIRAENQHGGKGNQQPLGMCGKIHSGDR